MTNFDSLIMIIKRMVGKLGNNRRGGSNPSPKLYPVRISYPPPKNRITGLASADPFVIS
jgi:hypothetical protein